MYSIIQTIESALSDIGTVGPQYIDDVNSFPSLALLRSSVARTHIGAGKIVQQLQFTIRGYNYTDLDTAIDDGEALARSIEYVIQTIRSPLFYNARVLSVGGDEGLFAPYSICDIICSVDWTDA
jgi:hypothetical protein